MNQIELSIVSPVYKAETIINTLVERIISAVSKITDSYEIILVEDGGLDDSWQRIKENCIKHPEVTGIKLSRNYGQQHAIQAGLDASRGQYIITMDCDLQDRPEEIAKLLEKAKEGYEVVVASRTNRQDNKLKKYFSKLFYLVLSYLTETKQDDSVSNFVCYHKKAINAMNLIKDKNRYYPMLQQMIGFNYYKIQVNHAERADGDSSYSFSKRLRLAIDTILTFSDKPLKLSIKFGAILTFISIILAIILVGLYIFSDVEAQGWSSLALMMSFFSGIIISILGMVGLYVGRTFESVKNRPTYIIQENTRNLDK